MSVARHIVQVHPRLLIGMAVGIVAAVFIPASTWISRCLIGWNAGVWFYLFSLWLMMVRADAKAVKRLAETEDESAQVVLVMVCVAAIASLLAILLELAGGSHHSEGGRLLRYAFTASTVFGSWALIGTIFTLHYARLFYADDDDPDALPLRFPEGQRNPDYWDFLYFAFTISGGADLRCRRGFALAAQVGAGPFADLLHLQCRHHRPVHQYRCRPGRQLSRPAPLAVGARMSAQWNRTGGRLS